MLPTLTVTAKRQRPTVMVSTSDCLNAVSDQPHCIPTNDHWPVQFSRSFKSGNECLRLWAWCLIQYVIATLTCTVCPAAAASQHIWRSKGFDLVFKVLLRRRSDKRHAWCHREHCAGCYRTLRRHHKLLTSSSTSRQEVTAGGRRLFSTENCLKVW